jgi:hypothetical protein
MANLFDKAKTGAVAKKAEKHEVVALPSLEADVIALAKLKTQMDGLAAKASVHDANIRTAGKEAMIDFYQTKKRFPGTLKIIAGKASYNFITSDRYKMLDEDRFMELASEYGKDLVEEATVYSFNTKILENHMDHISGLLMKSKELSDQEKEDLLTSKTSYAVKKGTIKDILTVCENVEHIVEDIQPVFSIKNVNGGE